MNPNKALWEKGDFTKIAELMRESGEALVKSIDVRTPLRVLDLGCGDGTTAVPLATVKDTYYFVSADKSSAHLSELLRRFYGPTINAFDAAQKSGRAEELFSRLVDLATVQNQSTNGGISIPATYLRVKIQL